MIHDLCDETNDAASASLLENWIDQTQRRVWFLFETGRTGAYLAGAPLVLFDGQTTTWHSNREPTRNSDHQQTVPQPLRHRLGAA